MAIQTKGVQLLPDALIDSAWVETFQISYSIDGMTWDLYQDKDGQIRVTVKKIHNRISISLDPRLKIEHQV